VNNLENSSKFEASFEKMSIEGKSPVDGQALTSEEVEDGAFIEMLPERIPASSAGASAGTTRPAT